ncbi:MAG: hypothetical protein QF415_14175 [Candidatus Undinarchaeales archaeon]|jgi:hypothetical protein|nr:hypothetical protein [Candidatus Undinarchaeales archaeon]MDP7494461.1 hypothetical protein [Candidatus Undinarchaeales archaeon]
MVRHRLAASVIVLMLIIPGALGGCIEILDTAVARQESYVYQLNTLSYSINNTCNGTRELEVYISAINDVSFLENATRRLELENLTSFSMPFYPINATEGPSFINVVVTDRTEAKYTLTGGQATLIVSNPLTSVASWSVAFAVLLAFILRKRLHQLIKNAPVLTLIGLYLIYCSYTLVTQDVVRTAVFEKGVLTSEVVLYVELAVVGIVLVLFNRSLAALFHRDPIAAIVALLAFAYVFPPTLYLGEDALEAITSWSLEPLNDELIFVFGLPLFVLKELTRVYFLAPVGMPLIIILGVPLTIFYWSVLLKFVERVLTSLRSDLAALRARLPVEVKVVVETNCKKKEDDDETSK